MLPDLRVAVPTSVVWSRRALGVVAVRISRMVPALGDTTVIEAAEIGVSKLSITPSPFLYAGNCWKYESVDQPVVGLPSSSLLTSR